jgi:hypothetical protein
MPTGENHDAGTGRNVGRLCGGDFAAADLATRIEPLARVEADDTTRVVVVTSLRRRPSRPHHAPV